MAGGVGLIKGLGVTLKTMMNRSVTRQYPDVKPVLPPRTRGVIALMEENCTVCMLCSRECPDWCIYIDSHKETVPPKEPGARARTRNILDRFAIDFALCMYCGICVEVCPFDALFWSPEFEYSEYDIRDLVHEKERLREWMYTVPAPPVLDPDGAPAAELTAAAKAEPKVYEAPSLGGVPAAAPAVAAPAPAAAAAPAAPAAEAAPAEAVPKKPQREHAEIAKEDVGVDQAVFDAAVAAGMPERQARAKAKSAWMKQWKKDNALAPEPEAPAEAAPATAPAGTEGGGGGDPAERLEERSGASEAGSPPPPSPDPAQAEHIDVGEPQIDQETYDKAIADGLPDRVARSKAKSAWVKKARKAAQEQ